ncbi:MAG: hypothetical protein JRN44_03590 [Nitrososphaerota archaeon]|nr:hypothetical protein [Nitrososphaerota archaeon]MDG6945829.1 hypothetical protein [Nitrososphaerota archaeon]MDG6947586.1 hypothetical protein [Nitrososphaerota archaeon]
MKSEKSTSSTISRSRFSLSDFAERASASLLVAVRMESALSWAARLAFSVSAAT